MVLPEPGIICKLREIAELSGPGSPEDTVAPRVKYKLINPYDFANSDYHIILGACRNNCTIYVLCGGRFLKKKKRAHKNGPI